MKQNNAETLNVGKEYAKVFAEAVDNAAKNTLIKNETIFVNEETGEITIEDTRAVFLINVGQEYQKLLSNL